MFLRGDRSLEGVTIAITDVAAIRVTVRKRLIRDFGASLGYVTSLARALRREFNFDAVY
jgi:hypothetical protein